MTDEQLQTMTAGAHILIAGATGSGKSVLLNNLIYYILRNNTVESLPQFIFCDPKRVELWQYKPLNNSLYCCDSVDIVRALERVISVMENRYNYMQGRNARKYDGKKIVVIIDELADLMLTCRRSVLPLLQRILQLGRASNIQIIACTQCPNRRVIPAELTLNFTDKIALRCDSGIESRQVINTAGAEKLPIYGQGIWRHPGALDKIDFGIVPDDYIVSAVSAFVQKNKTVNITLSEPKKNKSIINKIIKRLKRRA